MMSISGGLVRLVDNGLFSHILFGGYIGIFMWAGLLIRNGQIRLLLIP